MDFEVTGTYTHQGTEARTSGRLQIQGGEVSGELIDRGPAGKTEHAVDGMVQTQETLEDSEIPVLKFLKQPDNPLKPGVSWLLEKTEELNDPYDGPDQLTGEYEGSWSLNTDRDVVVAGTQYDPEMGVSMAIDNEPSTEGGAYLTLNSI